MAFVFVPALFFLVLYIILIGYYQKGFRQLKEYNSTTINGTTKVTVIIPARNEEKNIATCLHSIALQSYPKHLLQVIVVDDFSNDNTSNIVESFITSALPITLLSLKNFIQEKDTNSHKKKGIEIAISKATGELIICTDADCAANKSWISTIVSFYEKTNAQFIAMPTKLVDTLGGPTPLSFGEGLGVRPFQTLDFTTLQGITAASVYKNFHTMCNGANVAYTKAAFNAVNGFAGIDSIASGDDMLLMYKIKKQFPQQISYLKSKNVIVESLTVCTWKQFFQQRIRWASKASHYDDKNIFYALLVVYLLNVFALVLLVSLFFASQNWPWVFIFIGVKSIVEFSFLYPVLQFFNQRYLAKWFWVCIPFHILYTIIAGWFGKFGKVEWKGRKTP